uniref:DUF7745 domain-containing protein n=1 Tax=Fagus sylvatica TaxID=28930 RepID=A0A2N9GYF9_FAGSY
MASSGGNPDSLVVLRFHDFRAEQMRHWWTLIGKDDHANIVGIFGKFPSLMRLRVDHGLLEALASFWDPTHCCFSIGEVDLVPTLEEARGEWKKFRTNAFKIAFAGDREKGVPMFCIQLPSALVLQSPTLLLPPPDSLSLRATHGETDRRYGTPLYRHQPLPLSEWSWKATIPALLFVSLAAFSILLALVTFDYVPGDDMWRSLSWVESIWGGRCSKMVLVEGCLHVDSSVTPDFTEWRERWSPSFTLRPTMRLGVSHALVPSSLRASASTGQSERVAVLERELEEARAELLSLRLARASEREESAARVESMRSTLHHSNVVVANLGRDLETLVDPSTGRPHDIVALQRALDESEVALTSTRTSIGVMRVQISVLQGDNGVLQAEVDLVHDAFESDASWLSREGFPVVTALHQVNQVMDSLGARARAVLEEHDEGDSGPFHCLGEILHRDLHTSWSLDSILHVAMSS